MLPETVAPPDFNIGKELAAHCLLARRAVSPFYLLHEKILDNPRCKAYTIQKLQLRYVYANEDFRVRLYRLCPLSGVGLRGNACKGVVDVARSKWLRLFLLERMIP